MEPWLVSVVENMDQARMILPIIAAALISGGAGIVGSLINRNGQKEPARVKDPMRDPLTDALGSYYESKVGAKRPGYEGQLSADPNSTLMAAIAQATQQSRGYNNPIQDLITKFMSPAGSQGWNPTQPGWNRRPGQSSAGRGGASGAGISPEVAQMVAAKMGG